MSLFCFTALPEMSRRLVLNPVMHSFAPLSLPQWLRAFALRACDSNGAIP